MEKTKIKKLIGNSNFLDEKARQEWLSLADSASEKELFEIGNFFTKAGNAQQAFKFRLIHKANLDKKYTAKLKEISNKYMKTAIKKSEKHTQGESPEEILKKLDNL